MIVGAFAVHFRWAGHKVKLDKTHRKPQKLVLIRCIIKVHYAIRQRCSLDVVGLQLASAQATVANEG